MAGLLQRLPQHRPQAGRPGQGSALAAQRGQHDEAVRVPRQPRQQPGAQEGGLAGARCAQNDEERLDPAFTRQADLVDA
ncbi:MAG TPA: hypothetical protein PLL72_06890, partial [Burkholderiaceae bacterium]|nr:hypothetical protein [Burkholderiaceae bacterium]